MKKAIDYESRILSRIHQRANTRKNECFFVGFLDGLLANQRIDLTEVEPLVAECEALCRQVGDEDAAEILAELSAGHENTAQELLDLLGQIAEVRTKGIDPTCRRSFANRLLGFCAGVNCDNIITVREAEVLLGHLTSDHDLSDDPRIDALRHVLVDALQDAELTTEEAADISRLITTLVGDSYTDTGIPSSESIPVIHDLDEIDLTDLEGRQVVLTGQFAFGTRDEVGERLKGFGAVIQKTPSKQTDFVIVGSHGSPHFTYKHHGGKLAKALEMRANGPVPRIYVESQFRAAFR